MIAGQAKENRETTQFAGRNSDGTPKTSVCLNSDKPKKPIDTKKELAKLAGVGHDTMAKAKTVFTRASEPLKEKVRRGEVSIHAAAKQVQKETAARNKRIFDAWMACYTQEEIAEREGITQQAVALVLEDLTSFGNLADSCKALASHAADYEWPLFKGA